jgi:hypothetical protein
VRVRWGGPGLVSTSCEPPTANPAPSLPPLGPCGQSAAPPADHGGTSNPCAQRGRPAAASHSRVQRGADSTAAEPRTPKARPSGHLDGTGRLDTRRVDTGRPRDRLDGRPHGGQRTRIGRGPMSGHPWRPTTTRWAADLARVAASRGAWPPITTAVTTPVPRPWSPPLDNCAAPPLGRASAHCSPQKNFGSSLERTAKLHPLWRDRGWLGWPVLCVGCAGAGVQVECRWGLGVRG